MVPEVKDFSHNLFYFNEPQETVYPNDHSFFYSEIQFFKVVPKFL